MVVSTLSDSIILLKLYTANPNFTSFRILLAMDGNIKQQQTIKKPIEFMDLDDDVIEEIFRRLKDKHLVNIAYTCKRLQRLVRNFLPQKYEKQFKISSPLEISLELLDIIGNLGPSILNVVRLYPQTEIFHLTTHDLWEELYPIAENLTQIRELDLTIYV